MASLSQNVLESAKYIQETIGKSYIRPSAVIICGSGLGTLADALEEAIAIPYSDIPNFQVSTVAGHASKLVYGRLRGVHVLAMVGRFHFYEGYTMKQTTYPIRVFKHMQIDVIVVTNAAGGLNPSYKVRPIATRLDVLTKLHIGLVGDLMVIADHINMPGLCGQNALMGKNETDFGERFTPLSDAYDLHLRQRFFSAVDEMNISRPVHEGVYCFVSGPTYETRAECRMLRNAFAADVVGMSTVPEVIVARHSGLRVLAISLVTNACVQQAVPSGRAAEGTGAAMTDGIANHAEVMEAGKAAAQDMQSVISQVIAGLKASS